MATDAATYHSYLLRVWSLEQNGKAVWRCSLEETRSGQRRTFVDLEALVTFIRAEMPIKTVPNEEDES